MRVCIAQESCLHYTNGTKARSHYDRAITPCNKWLGYDCEKMPIICELEEFCTGKPTACKIDVKEKKLES